MVMAIQHDGLVPATQVFDQLWSVGQNAVSAWVLKTSEGLIVIDALNSPAEARDILVPNIVAMGLDPADIKYVIITHGHGDHWGGAKYLQDTYGARVVLSDIDWGLLESPDRGEVRVRGSGVSDERTRLELLRHRIGHVFQFHHLMPDLTLAENLGAGGGDRRWSDRSHAADA